jgi:hypothetical protein
VNVKFAAQRRDCWNSDRNSVSMNVVGCFGKPIEWKWVRRGKGSY